MTQVSSLYLHVPFCRHLCNYCDFYKRSFENPTEQIADYHQLLRAEIKRHEELLSKNGFELGELETIYLGGGTPSLWGKEGADFFQREILKNRMVINPEFTMEVDPGTWTEEMIAAWEKIGLNRISIGTQTLNPTFLKIMDRIHSLDETRELLSYCQKNDWNFSLDFLLGLPFSLEKKRNIQEELDELLSFKPKHISLYILNARSKYPHAQSLPDDEFIREEYLLVSAYLRKRGFHHYEVSNFALPGYESKHNQKYWRGESVTALGPTGTGYLSLTHDKALRYKWKVSQAEVEIEELGPTELELEKTYLSLRTSDGWSPSEGKKYLSVFREWESRHYGHFEHGKMTLNSLGFLMLDSLMDDLFRFENN
jgi:oxygen-independent coproporphyrinogen-3 oxidase